MHADYFSPLEGTAASGAGETGATSIQCIEKFVLPCGDAAKSWEHLTSLMEWNFRVGATKKSVVVAFGGGAVLNVAGLFASIAYRGMKLVYVPTTLLAMHDVVTSLKTSICFNGRKNNIGSFYAPVKILIDVGFCRTLPKNELFSGLGELAKNAALFGGEHADGFRKALSKDLIDAQSGGSGAEFSLSDDALLALVDLGIRAKMDMLLHDAYEKTTAMVFEYGHTMSHAIEKTYGDGVVPHGLGVTYGMLACSYVAERLGIMSKKAQEEHDEICHLLVQRWPLPQPLPPAGEVMARAMKDSKRGITSESVDEISDVLLRKVGDVLPSKTNMLNKFPSELFLEWLKSMGFSEKEI
jgi:3-dehydroquinate synthase/2-deoxy-scyllo-inosose synthase